VSAARYLEGVVLGIVCIGALACGGRRLRWRIAPFYDGPAARVADGLMVLALLILTLEAVGLIGVLDRVGVVVGCLVVGAVAWGVGESRAPSHDRGGDPGAVAIPNPHRRLVMTVAVAATAVVAAAWLGWTIFAYGHGMDTVDTIWYHMPYAARFVQLHNIRHLQYFDDGAITAFYPANSELIHAFGIVLFGNDVLSPSIDVVWGAAALCCAWAIGRPWGREPHCLLACAPVLATPGLVDTQPGGAYNDIVCLTLLLASIALLVNAHVDSDADRFPLGASLLAAAAAGLALGTKFTMIAPVLLLALGSVVILGRGARIRHMVAWAGGLILLGGYWYLRNWIAVGNPLPSLRIHLGPLSLPSPSQPPTYTIWEYLTNRNVWSKIFIPGLRESLGLAWWALLLGATAGGVLALITRREPRLRLIGGIALASGFLFLVTPQLLGLPGDPFYFVANVRYAVVPLALGLILLALAPALRRPSVCLTWLAASTLALLFTALDPGVWRSGFPVKAFAPPLHGTPALAGAAVGAVVLIAGELWVWWGPTLRDRAQRVTPRRGTLMSGSVAAAAAAAVAFGGWLVSDAYARDRYRDSQPMPTVYAWARHIHHARIGLVGLNQQYPLTGPDASNYVQFIGVGEPHGGFAPAATCQQWRAAINRGHYNYVLVTPVGFTSVDQAPGLRWTQTSPHAHPILRQYTNSVEFGVVFRITGELDPATCPAH
jgi:hypothetical protein